MGATGFLLVAYLWATQGYVFSPGDSEGSALGVRVVGPAMFGFFGLLMALAAVVGLRRLAQRRVLEIGPDGIWAPAVGRLAWREIAEMRHETYAAPAARRGGTMLVHRLGIVPVDPHRIHVSATERVVSLMSRGYMATIGRVSRMWTGAGDLTPLGIIAGEFSVPFDEVLARVREFFPVSEPPGPPLSLR